jgi:NAD(P)-dependent dehydrogenase (short-subunit alcohol dehydrogenase family)
MSRLQNKVAVITGGTSGIGLAAAQRFVAEGAFVYIFARRQQELDKTVASIGRNITGVQGDVRKLEDLDRLYAKVASDGRKLDVVVANIGAVDSVKLTDVTIESFNHNFDVNARGVLFTVQKSLPLLNNSASVILTSTIATLRGFPGRSAYAASKTALRSYARTWTMELKDRGIRVNTITPVRYTMEKLPGRDLWAVIDSVTRKPALVNDVPQIDLDLDDADDLTDLLNKLDREASASAKH